MKRFIGYRAELPEHYLAQGAGNPPNEPQYEGVVFSDGTVVCRWLTQYRSHSVWSTWDTFAAIHGHPEYGTRIDWPDGEPGMMPPTPSPARQGVDYITSRYANTTAGPYGQGGDLSSAVHPVHNSTATGIQVTAQTQVASD